MKYTAKHLQLIGAIGWLTLMVGITGCKSSGDRTMTQKWADRQVARSVRKELDSDPMYKYPDVVPVVYEGTVQLTAFLDNPQERQRAAELAAHAEGATQIINTIGLKPTPTGRPGP